MATTIVTFEVKPTGSGTWNATSSGVLGQGNTKWSAIVDAATKLNEHVDEGSGPGGSVVQDSEDDSEGAHDRE
jgi:hypothetical protein